MANKIEINKEDLKEFLLTLIKTLEASDKKFFSLDKDLYWSISSEELYNVYEEPKKMTIGSIKDDWEFLQKILSDNRKVIDYDFNKISNILRVLGDS